MPCDFNFAPVCGSLLFQRICYQITAGGRLDFFAPNNSIVFRLGCLVIKRQEVIQKLASLRDLPGSCSHKVNLAIFLV